MYRILNAHPVSVIVVMAAMMVTPIYALGTYVASKASARKGALIGAGFLLWGAFMTWVCLADITRSVGPFGRLDPFQRAGLGRRSCSCASAAGSWTCLSRSTGWSACNFGGRLAAYF